VHGGGLVLLRSALGLAGLRTGTLPCPLAIAALAAAAVDAWLRSCSLCQELHSLSQPGGSPAS
jgi:hypothetical protein